MSQTFVMDSRIPVGENISDDDPNHPKNVAKAAVITSAQANADTKYDITPPPRVEGFDMIMSTKQQDMLTTAAAIIAVVVAFIFALSARNMIFKIAFVAVIVMGIHYIIGKLENRTVYNFESREAI